MPYRVEKITQEQLDSIPKKANGELDASVKAYNMLKEFTKDFKIFIERDSIKDKDERLYKALMAKIELAKGESAPAAKKKVGEIIIASPGAAAPRKAATTKSAVKKATTKPAAKKVASKVDYLDANVSPDEVKISWKKPISLSELFDYGKVYELKTVENTCPKVGVLLGDTTPIFVKGNAIVKARKNELVEFVCTDSEKQEYRQFNIIGKIEDKCVFTAQIYKNGKRKELSCEGVEVKGAVKASSLIKKLEMPPTDAKGNKLTDKVSLERLDNYLKNAESTKSMHQVEGEYTKSRQLLHREIIDKALDGVKCVRRKKPIAVLMGGAPGAGKSTFTKKNAKWLKNDEIFAIDADDVRAELPEYKGWNAAITHLETRDIMKGYGNMKGLFDYLGKGMCSFDILYDGTMTNPKRYHSLIKELRAVGYRIFIIFVKVDKATSIERSNSRYKRGGKFGRYVPQFVIDAAHEKGLEPFNELKNKVDGYVLVDGVTQEIIEQGGEAIPKDRKYSELVKDVPCPEPKAKPCENGDKKKEATEKRTTKAQQYASGAKSGNALAEVVYMMGYSNSIGNADKIISKIMRRSDNRIVVQMNDYKNTSGGSKAIGEGEYFLFQEKDRKFIKSSKPEDYTLVDAKKEVLEEGEKPKSQLLDKVYSKKEEIALCYDIEKEMLKCKEGACHASEKAFYKGLIAQCSEKAGKQKFLKDLEKMFIQIFDQQKGNESFWQTYNRVGGKMAEKSTK